jgi:chromosome segregation ATPase
MADLREYVDGVLLPKPPRAGHAPPTNSELAAAVVVLARELKYAREELARYGEAMRRRVEVIEAELGRLKGTHETPSERLLDIQNEVADLRDALRDLDLTHALR